MRFKNKLLLLITSLIVISCSPLVAPLKKQDERVRLSMIPAKRKKEEVKQETRQEFRRRMYGEEAELKVVGGEVRAEVDLSEITVVAKSKNIPERAGKITLDFKVIVPVRLINNKWQVQLTPFADKNGKILTFDKILLSGAQFLRQQEKGYQMYQNFLNSIIPDSAYMQRLFDEKGYQKALFGLEEQFYSAWSKDLLSQSRFVDWRTVRNKRNMLFNGIMERNRASAHPKSWKSALPSHWLEREIGGVSGQWSNFLSPEYNFEQRNITAEDSIAISKRFFDYKRMMKNERKKALVDEKYNEYVRFPREECRLDTVIQQGDMFEYYYSQEIDADENIKKIDVMIDGEVIALDESRYSIPDSDTLTYYISSMVQFLDRAPRYKRIIQLRQARADITAYVQFVSGQTRFIESVGENKAEIDKVLETLHQLTWTGELVLDSVNMIATASPEGDNRVNLRLSEARAQELKKYLDERVEKENRDLFQPRAIGEDWNLLAEMIRTDANIHNAASIIDAIDREKNNDSKEYVLRKFGEDYSYIRKELYPRLRAVKFNFHLHRKEMLKDTIHTTVIDTAYMDAIKLLEDRQYRTVLPILEEYNDRNTAVCLMSLGYDKRAIEVLESLPENDDTLYLLAILYARERRTEQAIAAFKTACAIDVSKWYRGNLDPEINKLIIDHNLNFE